MHGLADVVNVDLLIRGALLAQDEDIFMSSRDSNLTDSERHGLDSERNPTLKGLSKELKTVLLACAIGAVVQQVSKFTLLSNPDQLTGIFKRLESRKHRRSQPSLALRVRSS